MIHSLAADLLRQAKDRSAQPALVFPDLGLTWTYTDLLAHSTYAAEVLRIAGLCPGDIVIMPADRSPAFFAAVFGVWFNGALIAPTNLDMTAAEMCDAVACCRPRFLAGRAASLERYGDCGAPLLPLEAPDSRPDDIARPVEPPAAEARAAVFFTSGTTGKPKGIVHTHRSLYASVVGTAGAFPFAPGDVILALLPLDHLHGFLKTVMLPLHFGGTAVIDRAFGAFSVPRFWDLVARYRVAAFSSVPSILAPLAKMHARLSEPSFPSLRFACCASATLSPELRREWFSRIGCPVANNYGLSEAASWVTHGSLEPDEPLESVGRASACRVEVVDEDDIPLPPGEAGEVTVAGEQLMTEYLGDPEATAAALRGGRLRTGDLGYLDDERRLYLIGRKQEVINVGGLKVDPSEIERAARELPGVAEAVALRWPDPHLGETPALAIVAAGEPPSLAEVKRQLAGRLSPHKLPLKLFVVDEIPKSGRGKIKRNALREALLNKNR